MTLSNIRRNLQAGLVAGVLSIGGCPQNLENFIETNPFQPVNPIAREEVCPPEVDSSWVEEGKEADVFVLRLRYDGGRISEDDFYIERIVFENAKHQPDNRYHARLVDKNGEDIFVVRFNFPSYHTEEIPDSGGNVYEFPHPREDVIEELHIPYQTNAKSIEIYDSECNRILDISVK